MSTIDVARYWRHPAVPGVDLLHARYRRHTFTRHSHASYAIGVVCHGAEELDVGERTERIGVGGTALLDPDAVHTGRPSHPDGWTYRVLYPPVELMAEVVAELGGPPGTPSFANQVVDDPRVAEALVSAHRAAETADRLASSSLLRLLLGLLWQAYGTQAREGQPRLARPTGWRAAAEARRLLLDRMLAPPSLDELAAELDTGRFALLRSFRSRYGLPPHAYLNQQRVHRARALLDAGFPPAAAATAVGFVDQAHLTRHFRRTVGVPPGSYARSRNNVQDPPEPLFLP